MRLGRYDFSRSGRQAITDEPTEYMDRLEQLARILDGIPWVLAGGLTIPLTLGAFYRPHYDVDVAFPLEEFPRVEDAMQRAGYYLSTYFPWSAFGALRSALSVPVRHDGWLVRRRPRKLVYRERARSERPHLISAVDALPYRVEGGRFVTCDGRFSLPLTHPIVGHRLTTRDGHLIRCLHLHYVGTLKKRVTEPKHSLDLKVIASAVGNL